MTEDLTLRILEEEELKVTSLLKLENLDRNLYGSFSQQREIIHFCHSKSKNLAILCFEGSEYALIVNFRATNKELDEYSIV